MKFLLISRRTGGREVAPAETESFLREFGAWLESVRPSAALPVHGGTTLTATTVGDYRGDVAGALIFEAGSLGQAVAMAQTSPGLKYGWTHDVLAEMPM